MSRPCCQWSARVVKVLVSLFSEMGWGWARYFRGGGGEGDAISGFSAATISCLDRVVSGRREL